MKQIKKPIGVSLDDELLGWLDARADREHTSRSEIIRKAVLSVMRAESDREDQLEQERRDYQVEKKGARK